MEPPQHVLLVMDVGKDFSMELLEWVIETFMLGEGSRKLTFLRIMPWRSIQLSLNTWPKMDYAELSLRRLCLSYGVVPEIITAMGHPQRLLVAEQIDILQPALVVFDKNHDSKNIDYYTGKITCNMVVMNSDGQVELIRRQTSCATTN